MQEFMRTRGVTVCPSFGTPEFRDMNIVRDKQRTEDNAKNSRRWVRAKTAKLQRAVRV